MAKRGRPTKTPLPGAKASLGLKVTAALKARLEDAATLSGRTQSQEAEHRLEQSFSQQDLGFDFLVARFGADAANMMIVLGSGMVCTNILGEMAKAIVEEDDDPKIPLIPRGDWLNDRDIYDAATVTIAKIFEKLRPRAKAGGAGQSGKRPIVWEAVSDIAARSVIDIGPDRDVLRVLMRAMKAYVRETKK